MVLIKQKITNGICILFAVVLTYFLVSSIVATRYQSLVGTVMIDTLFAVILVCCGVWVLRKRNYRGLLDRLSSRRILITLFAIIFVIHLLFAFSLVINPRDSGWDPLTVYDVSMKLLQSQPLSQDELTYFGAYQNNLGIVALMTSWFGFMQFIGVNDLQASLVVLNVTAMNIALILTYIVARKVIGKGGAAVALLLGVVFITFSLWSRTFYTDTIGLLFPIGCLYLIILIYETREDRRRRVFFAALFGIAIGLGYIMKPTVIFLPMAALTVFVLKSVWSRQFLRHYLLVGGVILIGFITPVVSISMTMAARINTSGEGMPLTSFAMLGLSKTCSPDECRYGAWNLPDALQYDKYPSAEEYREFTIDQIKSRLSAFGPLGYFTFLTEKGAWIIGDGTFYAYHEGTDKSAPLIHENPITNFAQSFMHPSGNWYLLFQNFLQVLWVTTLMLILSAFIFKDKKRPVVMDVIYIALFGLIVFLLLFEARSRYLYLYVPMFIVAASYGMSLLIRHKSNPRRAKRL